MKELETNKRQQQKKEIETEIMANQGVNSLIDQYGAKVREIVILGDRL